MAYLILLLLVQPPDSLVINRIQETAIYETKLWLIDIQEVKGVVIVKHGHKCYHKGKWGYPYEVIIVGVDTDNDAWIWDTAYLFWWEHGVWLFKNDESLEDILESQHDT
jgi:hypothetical protein